MQIGQKDQRQGKQDPGQKTEAEGIDPLKPGAFGGGQARKIGVTMLAFSCSGNDRLPAKGTFDHKLRDSHGIIRRPGGGPIN